MLNSTICIKKNNAICSKQNCKSENALTKKKLENITFLNFDKNSNINQPKNDEIIEIFSNDIVSKNIFDMFFTENKPSNVKKENNKSRKAKKRFKNKSKRKLK